MKSKFLNYIFWLVIAAAFIGPGTVTTAASAGASFQFQLLWALVFSTFACIIVQEAAARITIVSGNTLGGVIKDRFNKPLVWLIGMAIFLGCLAYEAGNILGAISGLSLLNIGLPKWFFTLIISMVSASLLFFNRTKTIPQVLGGLVALMGIGLLYAATRIGINLEELFSGLFVPSVPEGSTLMVLGLVGTTIVPYNIFLGSGLAAGKDLSSVRSGLIVSIILGGLISMAIIVVGSSILGEFSFENLYQQIGADHGQWMGYMFAFGLFGAGFTSTITAALAGALTIQSVHPKGKGWSQASKQMRLLWGGIILVGFILGASGIKPIPVIIAAQAANGFILPVVAIVLFILANSPFMNSKRNGLGLNIAMLATVFVTTILGLLNVFKAVYNVIGEVFKFDGVLVWIILSIALIVAFFTYYFALKERTVK